MRASTGVSPTAKEVAEVVEAAEAAQAGGADEPLKGSKIPKLPLDLPGRILNSRLDVLMQALEMLIDGAQRNIGRGTGKPGDYFDERMKQQEALAKAASKANNTPKKIENQTNDEVSATTKKESENKSEEADLAPEEEDKRDQRILKAWESVWENLISGGHSPEALKLAVRIYSTNESADFSCSKQSDLMIRADIIGSQHDSNVLSPKYVDDRFKEQVNSAYEKELDEFQRGIDRLVVSANDIKPISQIIDYTMAGIRKLRLDNKRTNSEKTLALENIKNAAVRFARSYSIEDSLDEVLEKGQSLIETIKENSGIEIKAFEQL
ncbi:MAG: hypothetical protein KDD56_05045 [Bdellovibrionales bacterium]|nr:hypothetical protein [Bdellovibrionales bacterium]